MIQLIVNADDFGLHTQINKGIIEGHVQGIITSTSILAAGDAFEEAIELAKAHPRLGVGIHTALVGGLRPTADPKEVPSLLVNGRFPETHIDFVKRLYKGIVKPKEILIELEAQFKRIIDTGLPITHVDGHQHLHMLPQVAPIVATLAKRYNISRVRIPSENLAFLNGVHNPVRIASKVALTEVANSAYPVFRDMGISAPLYFWGMMNGGNLNEKALLGILKKVRASRGTHEIMCHPGNNNRILGNVYSWGYHWEEELEALTSPMVKRFIEDHKIKLINFGDFSYSLDTSTVSKEHTENAHEVLESHTESNALLTSKNTLGESHD